MACNVKAIAETVLRHYTGRYKFKHGVIEDAVKRAEGLTNTDQIVNAIEAAFLAHKISINPNWDGSIG